MTEPATTTAGRPIPARRLEIVLGGPARPLALTAYEADLLSTVIPGALDTCREQNHVNPPADEIDEQADRDKIADLTTLYRRLREHAGFSPTGP